MVTDSHKIRSDYVSKMHKCDLDPVAHAKLLRVAGTTSMAYIDEFTVKVKILFLDLLRFLFFRNQFVALDSVATFSGVWKSF